jgi:glucosamine--fructose-6-phosphate aminotransferase (isomerizing)
LAELGARSAADIAEQPDVLAAVVGRNESAIENARRIVTNKRVVRLMGIGSSRHAAGYGSRVLDLIAKTPAIVQPAPGVAVPLPAFDPAQPFIVLSQSGRTPSVLDAVRQARSAHVDVIAITNEPDSPLEELATVTLHCEAGIERVVPATKSVTAQMLLLHAIALIPAVNDLAVSVRRALSIDLSDIVTGEAPSAIVCSGFAATWVADEIALKFTEMAGLLATSESVVEHFHGPRAANAATTAFLDPQDPNSRELARNPNVRTVETPSTGRSSLDPIVTVVLGQRIAHAWALHLGEDPDADRGLQKVTRTR